MEIEKLIAGHDGPLPELSQDEQQRLQQLARCVKAGLLERAVTEKQHRGEGLRLSAELPHLKMNC